MALHRIYKWQWLQIALWKIEENDLIDPDNLRLSPSDKEKLGKIKHAEKKSEFLASRAALKHLIEDIDGLSFGKDGKPHLPNLQGVSISHCHSYAAAAISSNLDIGVDVENYRAQFPKIAKRFLSEQELNSVGKTESLRQLAGFWCAKESLIKLCGNTKLDLRKDLRVSPIKLSKRQVCEGLIRENSQLIAHPVFIKSEPDYCLGFSYRKPNLN
jgi:4'-phosphopantetheinyl transferase